MADQRAVIDGSGNERGEESGGHGDPEPAFERRRRPRPATPREYLEQMPALVLLDRLPTPMLAAGLDGQLIYVNPALSAMLGYASPDEVVDETLPSLLAVSADTPAAECVTTLRQAAGKVVDWCHREGYRVHAVVSNALLARANDPVLLVTLTDVSELHWTSKSTSGHRRS